MMRSLYSAVSGLKTHQTRMDVIGNNIANVNTEAFKASSVRFSEIMYQTTSGASAGNGASGTGGKNAKQIGLGVKSGATAVNITGAGSAETTGNPFDLRLNDKNATNFFVVSDGTNRLFTRAGDFYVDGNGYLCMSSTGYTLQGWQVDAKGNVIKDTVSSLQVMSSATKTSAPEATTKAYVSGVLDKNDAQAANTGRIITIGFFDDLGYNYTAKFGIKKTNTECIFYPDSVNASQSPSPSGDISTNDVTNDLDDVKSLDSGDKDLADATSDSTNGLNIYYNNESGSLSTPVRMFLVLTVLSLAPSILIMLTSFTRIIIVLHFVRTAIGTQTAPPNQVLVGLALFLTLFIMWPTFSQVNEKAIKPLDEGKITQQEAIKEAEGPFREFMYGQTQTKDIKLFVDISGDEYDDYDDVPFTTLVPAFILSELRTAFILGFLIYIPFIVIDMVVSSVLMSMGMMMLPPTTISMPFKVLLFILADGWDLVIGNLVKTFY